MDPFDTAERAGIAQQARVFDGVLSSLLDFVYVFDRRGRFTYVNQALLGLWGLRLEDAVGKDFFDLGYPPALAQRLQDQIEHVFRTGEVVRDETEYVSPAGHRGFYEYIFTAVRNERGAIQVVAGSTRDITSRKATELALERTLATANFLFTLDDALRRLIDAEEITYAAASMLGQHLQVNRCAYASVDDDQNTFHLTGNYTNGVHSIIGRYTFRQFGAECLRLMRAGEPYVVTDSDTDERIDADDRQAYRLTAIRAVVCVPILKAGRFVAAMAVHTDTPRVWSETDVRLVQQVASRCWESIERARVTVRERLARQDAELQKRVLYSLFMQAPMLIAILRGPNHVVDLANQRVCDVWNRIEDDLLGRPLFDVLPELRDQVFKRLLDDVFATGVSHTGYETPATFERPDGPETVYFNFVYSPFRNIDDEIEGIFVVASEVTEQVRARQEIDNLRQTAESANRAKDEFLAMLGHELRNPLSPILTALELMKLRGGDSHRRERTVIERQVSHLTRLVDDLLDVSRIAQGKVELRTEVVELSEIVSKAVELTSPLLEERLHRFVLDVPSTGLPIHGDATRLAQVVANLLTNAAKYTNRGGLITLRAQQDGGTAVLTVQDTGIGIAPDTLPHVFDLFVQERQQSDRAQGGLGLGLTIVRSLVERHGGTVAARSEGNGCGSEFIVRLPIATVRLAAGNEVEAPAGAVSHPAGRRILVVDDNEDGAFMLAQLLSAAGHTTHIEHNGPAALDAARTFAPDVAFLDIGLPVMDGYELAERLREMPGLEQVTLIALTGYGQASDRARARMAGFDHHLVKPVDVAAITEVLADAR
jgi:PAS domain S-box-containing protein